MVAEAGFGIVSGVVICRPGGSHPRSLLVSSRVIITASAFSDCIRLAEDAEDDH